MVSGCWAAGVISQWIGGHWQGARPIVLFWALRWLVAALAGFALAAIFQWWGDRLGQAIRKGPLGWLDRGVGTVLGAGIGGVVCAFALLVALMIERPKGAGAAVARARVGVPTLGVAAEVCAFGEPYFAGCGWLKERFLKAERRALRIRAGGDRTVTS